MNQVAVIYWSGTGNTLSMAEAIAQGAKDAGADVTLLPVGETTASAAAAYGKLALGCPSMGDEVLEESEFEPFFQELESQLSGKTVLLFGSYGWGNGQWMRDWVERTDSAGANLCGDGLIVNEAPNADELEQCRALGKDLATA